MGPPAWLFSQNPNNDTKPSAPAAAMAKKKSDPKAQAKPQPPARLLDLVEQFLSDNALEAAQTALKAQRAKNGWPAAAAALDTTLLSVFEAWEKSAPKATTGAAVEKKSSSKTLKRKEPPSSAESSEASSSEAESSSSESEAESDEEEEQKEARPASEPKKSKPQPKKQKVEPDAESSESSSSESESEESSSEESASSEESDDEASDNEDDVDKTAKAAPKSDSDSDSGSDSDSDEDEDKDGDADKKTKEEPKPRTEPASEATNGVNGNGNGKTQNEPFSRIPKDIKVDPKFASNAYVPVSYSLRAHEDLIVTRGKGFTKEKNKKKKGSFRGGNIDIHEKKSIYFDD